MDRFRPRSRTTTLPDSAKATRWRAGLGFQRLPQKVSRAHLAVKKRRSGSVVIAQPCGRRVVVKMAAALRHVWQWLLKPGRGAVFVIAAGHGSIGRQRDE